MSWDMTMAEPKTDITDLDALFQAARQDGTQMPDGLSARITADAAQVQAERASALAAPRPSGGRWMQLRDVLGGWPGFGGLAAACAVGVWLGFAPPAMLPDPVQLVAQSETDVELFEGDGLVVAFLEEN